MWWFPLETLCRNLRDVAFATLHDESWNEHLGITQAERLVCIEVALHKIAEAFAAWPDNWKHKHYFGAPLVTHCSCGVCPHEELFSRCIECNPWVNGIGHLMLSINGLFVRDVQ